MYHDKQPTLTEDDSDSDDQQSQKLLSHNAEESSDSLESQTPITSISERHGRFAYWVNSRAVRPHVKTLLTILAVVAISVVTALAFLAANSSRLKQVTHKPQYTDCGNSPAEARKRGCSFDMLSHAWQISECYDHEISEAYMAHGKWEYYLDRDGVNPVSIDVVRAGETEVWLREAQHVVHCTYMWRQMHRAFTSGYIDSHLNNYNHTLHCQHYLLNPPEGNTLEVFAQILYPSCNPIGSEVKVEQSKYIDYNN